MVVAADAALAAGLVTDEQRPAYDAYLEEVRKASDIERLSTDRPKTGVFLGVHATNPVTGTSIPVYAADYVLADYGTACRSSAPSSPPRAGRATPSPATDLRSTRATSRWTWTAWASPRPSAR